MILETERLILRPWEESDAGDLYEYAKDDRVGPSAGWPPHTSIENSREVIRNTLSQPETFAVCLKGDNLTIGSIGLKLNGSTDMTERDDECELGYWLGVPFWGKGLMPEAAREVIRHGFVDLGMNTIWCSYYDGNEKSKRVQEKCGFTYHHTCSDVPVPLLNEIRVGHTNILTKEQWKVGFTIRKLKDSEIPAALSLAWKVFCEYEAPDYSAEGTEEFQNCLQDKTYLAGIEYFGAIDRDTLIGMVGIRKTTSHICFFFVSGKYHRLGIGTKLFYRIKMGYPNKPITVNSSPYAFPFYKSLGFHGTESVQTVKGICFTPMALENKQQKAIFHLSKGGEPIDKLAAKTF